MELLILLAQTTSEVVVDLPAIPAPVVSWALAFFQALVLAAMARRWVVRDRVDEEKRKALAADRERQEAWEAKIEEWLKRIEGKEGDQDAALLRVERKVIEIGDFIEPIRDAERAWLREQFGRKYTGDPSSS